MLRRNKNSISLSTLESDDKNNKNDKNDNASELLFCIEDVTETSSEMSSSESQLSERQLSERKSPTDSIDDRDFNEGVDEYKEMKKTEKIQVGDIFDHFSPFDDGDDESEFGDDLTDCDSAFKSNGCDAQVVTVNGKVSSEDGDGLDDENIKAIIKHCPELRTIDDPLQYAFALGNLLVKFKNQQNQYRFFPIKSQDKQVDNSVPEIPRVSLYNKLSW